MFNAEFQGNDLSPCFQMPVEKGMKQKTLFDFGTKATKEPIFPKER